MVSKRIQETATSDPGEMPQLVKLADLTAMRRIAAVKLGMEDDAKAPQTAKKLEELNVLREGYTAVAEAQSVRAATYGGGASAWLNEMARWPRSLVMRVLKDNTAPMVARAAAQRIIQAERKGFEGGKEFDRICDRTSGKPHQAVSIAATRTRSPDELLQEARRMAGLDIATLVNSSVDAVGAENDAKLLPKGSA